MIMKLNRDQKRKRSGLLWEKTTSRTRGNLQVEGTGNFEKLNSRNQEFITVRVCNFHMLSAPTIWIGWLAISSEYAYQVLNMKPFQVLVCISYVNTVAKACLFTAVFSQLTTFTAYNIHCCCLSHPNQIVGIDCVPKWAWLRVAVTSRARRRYSDDVT